MTVVRVLLSGCLIVAAAFAQPPSGDYVLINGKVITVDERDTIAQAAAITAKIMAVGTNAEVRRAAGRGSLSICTACRPRSRAMSREFH